MSEQRLVPDPEGVEGADYVLAYPGLGAWITVAGVSVLIRETLEGSVEVEAFESGGECNTPIASMKVRNPKAGGNV